MLSLFNICINPVNSKQEKKKNVYFDEIFLEIFARIKMSVSLHP